MQQSALVDMVAENKQKGTLKNLLTGSTCEQSMWTVSATINNKTSSDNL